MNEKGNKNNYELHTLSHTTWNCKYHVVFAPKYKELLKVGETVKKWLG